MFTKRLKIFVIFCAALLSVCLFRLARMQLLPHSGLEGKLVELKKGKSHQLKTIRGKILDRKGRTLASDDVRFGLYINYKLSRFQDERVRKAKLLKIAKQTNPDPNLADLQKDLEAKLADLQQITEKCSRFGLEKARMEKKINQLNDRLWNTRTFVAWVRAGPNQSILKKYNRQINSIPLSEALADFEKKFPLEDDRILQIATVDDIKEMDTSQLLVELKTDDDLFTAQFEFLDVDGIRVLPKVRRLYPHNSAAAQTIGWVGLAQEHHKKLFANDKLAKYLSGELCGRDDGIEYVCESILRGRRGEVEYDIDKKTVKRTETEFGRDVRLTLDIQLQKKIQQHLADSKLNPDNYKAPTSAVVIDVATGDILALVSMPAYNPNRIGDDYIHLANDQNEPLRNRAINAQYPPGSVIKPLVLIAGLETGKISRHEIISCPARRAPKYWPNCWIFNRYGLGHDDRWLSDGGNNARNAIKGSCNIYFSRLANRLDSAALQSWLYKFGYGHQIPLAAPLHTTNNENPELQIEIRELRQAQGQISSVIPGAKISNFEQVPTLDAGERRQFGIGQGNLRATPLQVANAMAAIARGGFYKPPRLFLAPAPTTTGNQPSSIDLGISSRTLDVVYEGMSAVVSEPGGTAYKEFAHSGLPEQGVKVHGKTGSTTEPDHAWFAGFATDTAGRSIAVAVVVEGGQHGSSDAAPLARNIIQFTLDHGYLAQHDQKP